MELGSEFYLDLSQLTDTPPDTVFTYLEEFHTIYTDSGRSALRLLSERLQGTTILVPDYICEAVTDALPRDCHIIYYPINCQFQINMEELEKLLQVHAVQFLYLMHYFGTLQPRDCMDGIAYLKGKYHLTIIEDTTHSIFTAPRTVGDYLIASLRKWFPIPDGGVLYTERGNPLPEPPQEKKPPSQKVEAMLLKKLYLTENFDCNAKYREIFAREEAAFCHQMGIYGISDVGYFLLSHFSVKSMCHSRRRNAAQLLEGLQGICEECGMQHQSGQQEMQYQSGRQEMQHQSGQQEIQHQSGQQEIQCQLEGLQQHGYGLAIRLQPADVPLALPIYAAKRDVLRKRLTERSVYCAVHWPFGHPDVFADSRWIGSHILSLPIDQRYQREEMEYLLDCLESCNMALFGSWQM